MSVDVGDLTENLRQAAEHSTFRCTDYGNAERLAYRHGEDLHYCYPWRKWLTWDGHRWRPDETGVPETCAKLTVRSIYAEAQGEHDEDRRKRLAAWGTKSEADARLKAMTALARSEPGIPVVPGELDADPWLLNVANGTLDLRDGTLREHRRGDLLTKLVPGAYEPDTDAPAWTKFLKRIMGDDEDLIRFLQRAVGYSLTGDTSEHCLFMPWGSGANGKSVFLVTVAALLGGYGMQAAPDLIAKKPGGTVPNDLAALRGARFVSVIETAENERLDEPLIKHITGGDLLTARFLYGEYFQFAPQLKLWLATNHKPDIRGTDYGIWRRIRLIPFTVTIPEEERDPHLTDQLRAELPGILAWAVRGCLDWQRHGLQVPQAVRDATDGYRREQDPLAQFIDEMCTTGPGVYAFAADLYEAYEKHGGVRMSKQMLGRRLREKGYDRAAMGHGNRSAWVGLALKSGGAE